jgi:hypothetical protein
MTRRNRSEWNPSLILAVSLIAMLLMTGIAAADPSLSAAWTKTFSLEENNKFDAVQHTTDGGFIAAGSTLSQAVGASEDMLLVKTDAMGDEVWNRTIPQMVASSVEETTDGGYVIGSYTITSPKLSQNDTTQGTSFMIKTDAGGSEEWRQVLPGEKVSVVRPTGDGGYIVIGWLWNPPGSTDDTTAVITKTDERGSPVWNRTFPGLAANAGMQTADGGYIIGGTRSPYTYDVGDAFLIRLDASGNTLWNRTYEIPVILALQETEDGGYVFSGNYWYGRTDAQGESLWLQKMDGMNGYAVVLQPAGGYMVAGQNIRTGDAFAFGTDAEGVVQWNTTIPGAAAYAADTAGDGDFVLAGITYLTQNTSAAWMLKLTQAAEPTPAASGFGAGIIAAAFLLLLATRCRRR